MTLDVTRRSELVERTLRHPWEDVDHRIDPILLVSKGERDHLNPKGEKGSIKESVHQEQLA